MLTSLALIFLVGLSLAAIFGKLKLPRLIGMLLTGILLGPFVLDLLDPQILGISADLRKMALVIILIKAGISLNFSDLKKVGRPALLMSFLPAMFEIAAFGTEGRAPKHETSIQKNMHISPIASKNSSRMLALHLM